MRKIMEDQAQMETPVEAQGKIMPGTHVLS
jgi:hypothetical protein